MSNIFNLNHYIVSEVYMYQYVHVHICILDYQSPILGWSLVGTAKSMYIL